MKTKDIDIKDHHYYADADVFLIRGYRCGSGKNLPRAVVGWMFRTSPAKLIETQSFPDIPAAMKAYQSILESGAFPDKVLDVQDEWKQKVYDWEDKILCPVFDVPVNDQDAARKIVRRVSRDMGMPSPKLIWSKDRSCSEYDETSHIITFGHRELLPLLHELAHATYNRKLEEADNENAMHHSPGFVWHAIDLYHRYAGISLDHLVHSATAAGILGPLTVQGPEHYICNAMPKPKLRGPTPG